MHIQRFSPLICNFTFTFPLSPSALHLCVSSFALTFSPHLRFVPLMFTLCLSPSALHPSRAFREPKGSSKCLFQKAFQSLFFQRLLPGAFPWPCSDPLFPEGSPRRLSNPLQTAFQKAQELSKKAFTKPLPRSSKFFSQGCSRGQRPFQGCSANG